MQQQLQVTADGSAKVGSRLAGDKDSAWGQHGLLRMQSLGSSQTACTHSTQADHKAMPGHAGSSDLSSRQQYVRPAPAARSPTSATSAAVQPAGLLRRQSTGPGSATAAAGRSRDVESASVHAAGFERRSSSGGIAADQLHKFSSVGSMRSIATDGTWLTDATALKDTSAPSTASAAAAAAAKSLRGDSHCRSCVTDVEMVYDMTGEPLLIAIVG